MTSQKKSKLTNNLIDSVLTDLKKVDATTFDVNAFDPFPMNTGERKTEKPIVPPSAQDIAQENSNAALPISRPAEFPDEEAELAEEAEKVSSAVAANARRTKAALAANKSMPLIEADLKQSENLKIAQSRILELESSIESMRLENENLTAALQVARDRDEDISGRIQTLERTKIEIREQWAQEISIFKENLSNRDTEVHRLRTRIDELENRLQSDLRRVRVRERELENRLEIGKNDKIAIIKAKDETILDLKRKTDQLYSDLEKYKLKSLELSHKIDSNNEQFGRTIRALRIALANLEAAEETKSTLLTALKKVD